MRWTFKPASQKKRAQAALRSALKGFRVRRSTSGLARAVDYSKFVWSGVVYVFLLIVTPVRWTGFVLARTGRIFLWPLTNKLGRYLLALVFLVGILGLLYVLKELPSPRNLTMQ
jgi:hypothetical protein